MSLGQSIFLNARRVSRILQHRIVRHRPLRSLERRLPLDVIVFMYHVISEERLPYISHLYQYKTPAEFEADVVYLKNHYELPTWQEFLHRRNERQISTRPPAILTFDDGLSQCFHYVRPILLKHRIPCIFFVCKDFVDNARMFYRNKVALCLERVSTAALQEQQHMLHTVGAAFGIGGFSPIGFSTWLRGLEIVNEDSIDQVCQLLEVNVAKELQHRQPYLTTGQIKQLSADGFTIGGHSIRHGHVQLLGAVELEQEIVESCNFARELVGATDVPFAFPFGGEGLDCQFLNSLVKRHPLIRSMFDTAGHAADAPFIIQRIGADDPSPMPPGQSGLEGVTRSFYIDQLCRPHP